MFYNVASFSLSDEEGEETKPPTPQRLSPLSEGHSWALGCIGRQDAISRSITNIAGGLRLAHTHTLAVAGVVGNMQQDAATAPTPELPSPPPASPFRRCERASFHGRGSARPLTFPRTTPSTPPPVVPMPRPKLPIPPRPTASHQRTLPSVPGPSSLSAKATSFLSKDSQLLSVKTLLQQVVSLRPRAVLASLSPRPCHRFLPRPPLTQSHSHPNLHSPSSSVYSSTESIASQPETPPTMRSNPVGNIRDISSVASGKIRIPEHSPVYEFRSQCNPKRPHKGNKSRLIRPTQVSRLSNHSDCCHFFNRPTHICRYQDDSRYHSPPPPAPSQSPLHNSPLHTTTPVQDTPNTSPGISSVQTPTFSILQEPSFAISYQPSSICKGRNPTYARYKLTRDMSLHPSHLDTDVDDEYYTSENFTEDFPNYPRHTSSIRNNPLSSSSQLPYHLLHQYLLEEKVSASPPASPLASPTHLPLHLSSLYPLSPTSPSTSMKPSVPNYNLCPVSEKTECSKGALQWDETCTEAVSEKFAALFTQDLPGPSTVSQNTTSQRDIHHYPSNADVPSSSVPSLQSSLVQSVKEVFKREDKSRHIHDATSPLSTTLSSQALRMQGSKSTASLMSLSLR